jgi:hypothetical protein
VTAYEKKGRHGHGALILVLLRAQRINLGHLEARAYDRIFAVIVPALAVGGADEQPE